MNILLILAAGSQKQNYCWWPSYLNADAGIKHEILAGYVDKSHLPAKLPSNVRAISNIKDGVNIPHKAFGVYREYFYQNKDKYDIFGFISDDVIVKSDNWLAKAVDWFKLDKLGFVGTQIFNGGTKYPHPSHMRAPCWFATNEALSKINWEFLDDHDGEMKIADQFLEAGYFGVQAGNKVSIAYDAIEPGHISSLIEERVLHHSPTAKWDEEELEDIDFFLTYGLYRHADIAINSPYPWIGTRFVIKDIQPFNGLIYEPSIDIATKLHKTVNVGEMYICLK